MVVTFITGILEYNLVDTLKCRRRFVAHTPVGRGDTRGVDLPLT